jgi:ceramide glucosyltransferase
MSRLLEWVLVSWSLLAVCWWGLAIWLVSRERHQPHRRNRDVLDITPRNRPTVSIFKPMAALRGDAPPRELIAALESFVSQLDGDGEMLLGIEEPDAPKWQPVIEQWRKRFPHAQLKPIAVPRPARFLSPKVSWFHTLADHASGELWMWSDSDILGPMGLLDTMRRELMCGNAGMLTCPYVVRNIERAPMMLEALFVNVEFYPGVLFCKRTGPVRFGLGAGMMFSAARFRERAKWKELGARMADDNALGRALAPVTISGTTVETFAAESNWRDAIQHYLRWQKTVRWCQSAGYAGQIVILPVLGWLVAALTHPGSVAAWLGLLVMIQIEVLAAAMVFWLVGCELRAWWVISLWSALLRPLTWLACWMPWPVVFHSQNRKWWSLYRSAPLEGEP